MIKKLDSILFICRQAVADLLLGVFCMPFTLIGQLLRDFIFGSFMCKIIPYFQGESVHYYSAL